MGVQSDIKARRKRIFFCALVLDAQKYTRVRGLKIYLVLLLDDTHAVGYPFKNLNEMCTTALPSIICA